MIWKRWGKRSYKVNDIRLFPVHYDAEKEMVFFFCKDATEEQIERLKNVFGIEHIYLKVNKDNSIVYDENYDSRFLEQEQFKFFDFYITKEAYLNVPDFKNGKYMGSKDVFDMTIDLPFRDDYHDEDDYDFYWGFVIHEDNTVSSEMCDSFEKDHLINLKSCDSFRDEPSKMSAIAPDFINVGHGLSFFDLGSNLIYDAGGGIHEEEYIKRLNSKTLGTRDMKLFVSHLHYDHYKYAFALLKSGIVSDVFFGENLVGGKNAQKLLDKYKDRLWVIHDGYKYGDYTFKVPGKSIKKLYKGKHISNRLEFNKNLRSVIAFSDEVMLTGDSDYKIIFNTIFGSAHVNKWKTIQVPYHGAMNDLRFNQDAYFFDWTMTRGWFNADEYVISCKKKSRVHPSRGTLYFLRNKLFHSPLIYKVHEEGTDQL